MTDINQQLSRIQSLAYELVQKYEEALIDNESLRKQISSLQGEITDKDRKLALLENDLKLAKVARGMAGNGEDANLAKSRINTLVREIDRCIALLNE